MISVKKLLLIFTAVSIVLILATGCSDNTIVTYVDGTSISSQSQVESFFPMNEGYVTVYNVTYPLYGSSEIVTFRAGAKKQFQSKEVTPWYGFSNSSVDTGYFYTSSDALYYLSHLGDTPDKLLDFPLSIGKVWGSEDDDGDIYIDIITGGEDSTGSGGGTFGKTFPTISAVQYTISEIDGITLDHGVYYSKAVLVSTPSGGKTNYYWYVNGIGLVRYVIGATSISFPSGDIVGELVQYGY